MKVKWMGNDIGNRTLDAHEKEVDWVRLGPNNKACLAWNEGTQVNVVSYTEIQFIASPGNQVRCYGGTYYESEV